MLKRLILFILSFGLAQLLQASLTDEDIIKIMNERPIEGYSTSPTEHGLPPSSSGFIILNYDQNVIDGIWRILENPEQQKYWKHAFINLRRIASAEADQINFDRLTDSVEGIEQSETINSNDKVYLLRMGYNAIARQRNDSALEFLRNRTKFDFWQGKGISKTVYNSHGAGSEGILKSGQTEAISALDEIQTEEAYKLLQALAVDPKYIEEPHLFLTLRSSIEYGWEASAGRLKTIQTEYAKRLELRGKSSPVPLIKEPAVEIPTPPAAVVETTEELPTVENEIKEPAEVKPVEVTEETSEESSQWWLWLIGALVVLGGLAVVVRRKS